MKSWFFNGLVMGGLVLGLYEPLRKMPDRTPRPAATTPVRYTVVTLPQATAPLRLAGAWQVEADDRRFGGLSGLAIDRGQFVAVSDLGAAIRFDPPSAAAPMARIADLAEGPGDPAFKTSRDAESLVRDPRGSGWLVSFEQRHSVWRYDDRFRAGVMVAALDLRGWRRNRGIEAMVVDEGSLLLAAENGREMVRIDGQGKSWITLAAGMEVADAATAPDGSHWLLLRSKGPGGIAQAIAPLVPSKDGYRIGEPSALPKAMFDNHEGMAIAPRPGGGWRIWLVTDDGHRVMARTLLVALDFDPQKQTPDAKRRALNSPR